MGNRKNFHEMDIEQIISMWRTEYQRSTHKNNDVSCPHQREENALTILETP